MAAAAADASHHITKLTLEEEGRRTVAKLFGSTAPLPRIERKREREKGEDGKREREDEQEIERASGNECLVCGALFASQDKLRLHTLSHTGDKPFHCSQPHCPKAFSSKYKLFR